MLDTTNRIHSITKVKATTYHVSIEGKEYSHVAFVNVATAAVTVKIRE